MGWLREFLPSFSIETMPGWIPDYWAIFIDCSNSGHYITLIRPIFELFLLTLALSLSLFPYLFSLLPYLVLYHVRLRFFDNPPHFSMYIWYRKAISPRHVVFELFLSDAVPRTFLRKCHDGRCHSGWPPIYHFLQWDREANIVALNGRKCFCAPPLSNNKHNFWITHCVFGAFRRLAPAHIGKDYNRTL